MNAEAERVGRQIHMQWPFISAFEATSFYESLGQIGVTEGTVRVSLWVLQQVLWAASQTIPATRKR